jgi:phenylacetate-coenzyme A ligase PaaK-like adenylate-forming protein
MSTNILKTQGHRLSEATVQRLQMERLRRYLHTVVLPFSSHYRELFRRHGITPDALRVMEDLDMIPFSSKEDLLNTPEHPQRARDFVVIPDEKVLSRRASTVWRAMISGKQAVKRGFEKEFRPIFLTSTTGRSADPIPFLYSQLDLGNLASAGRRVMEVCGAEHDLRLLNMFPYAPHLAFWLTHYASTEFGIFTLSSGGGKVMGTDGNLRMIKKIKPDVLIGMPTFLYHVMQQMVDEGQRLENLRKLVLGGEKVADGMRQKLRELARKLGAGEVDVLATYGFTEAKMAWAECPHSAEAESGGYHLYPDLGIVEVVDPKSGNVQPPGTPGELVFTPLDARGTVVLRYRTGDVIDGGLFYDPCPHCGRMAPRLVGKISRNSEIKSMKLDKIKGTLVDFNQLEHVLDDASGVSSWQLELRKHNDDPMDLDELVLHVHKSADVSEERVGKELSDRFVERTEIRPNRIEFHGADQLREMLGVGVELKELKIVDHRPGKGESSPKVAGVSMDPGPVESRQQSKQPGVSVEVGT